MLRIIRASITQFISQLEDFSPYLPGNSTAFLNIYVMKILGTWRMAVLSAIYSWSRRAHGQGPDSTTIVFTQYHVKATYRDNFLDALRLYILTSLRATGNIMAEAYYEKGDSCIMWIIERWSSRTFYKDNKRSAAAKVINALTKIGLASPVETIFIKDLEFFSKDISGHTPIARDQPITVMLFLDVKTGTENYFRSINQNVTAAFRNEPGVLAFQLSQVFHHKTRFIIYKKFRDWDAFRYHLKDPALEPVIKFLQTAIKEPPFEKGYHRLIQFAPL